MQIWIFTVLFHTCYSQFVLMYFCVYIYIYIYIYSTSLLYATFINFSEVLSCVCYSACFHTISLYVFVFETLHSSLLLLTDKRPYGLLTTHSLAAGTLPTLYHRSFNNLFIAIFLICYSFCIFVLF